MLKLEPFPSALLDKRGEGKGLGDKDIRERRLDSCSVCVWVCFLFLMSNFQCKICVNDSNSEALGFPLSNRYH